MIEMSMYSIGSAAFLREVFNGLAMITGTGDFVKAVMIGMLFSTLLVCFQAILRGGREIAWQNILVGWILYGMFFAVPARVIIEDVDRGDANFSGGVYSVDNVPLGAAVSGFIISRVGHGLTDLLETGYGSADRTSQLPFLSSLNYLLWAERTADSSILLDKLDDKTSMNVRATLNEYLRNCVVHELVKHGTGEKGVTANNANVLKLLELGSNDHNNFTAIYRIKSGQTVQDPVPCSEGYNEINATIVPQLKTDSVSGILEDLTKDWSNPSGDYYHSTYGQSISEVFDRLHVFSAGRQDWMAAAIIKPIFDSAFAEWHSRSGVIADLSVVQAMLQRNVQWTAEQALWGSVVHPLMTFFEGFVYAITPFVALLLFTGSVGLGLVGKYLQVLFWISLWEPIMSICNLYLTMTVEGSLRTINMGTFNGVEQVVSTLQNQIATGGMLMTATPMLALFIVTGSTYAFTTLTSRLNGGDHINEKILAPDLTSTGAVFKEADYMLGDRTRGAATNKSEAFAKKITFSNVMSEQDASTLKKAEADMDAWSYAYFNNHALRDTVTKSQAYAYNANASVQQMFSNASESMRATAKALMADHAFRVSVGLGSPIPGLEASIGYSGTAGYKSELRGQAAGMLRAALSQAGAQTYTNELKNGIGKSWDTDEGNRFQDMAQRAVQAEKSYTNIMSSQSSFGGTYQFDGQQAGYLISHALQGKNGEKLAGLLSQAKSILGASNVQQQANVLNSTIYGNRAPQHAYNQAILEGLAGLKNQTGNQLGLAIAREAGLQPTEFTSNPYEYSGIRAPRGADQIHTVHPGPWVKEAQQDAQKQAPIRQVKTQYEDLPMPLDPDGGNDKGPNNNPPPQTPQEYKKMPSGD